MVACLERIANERGHKRFQASKPASSSSMAETLQNLEQYSGQMTAKELDEVIEMFFFKLENMQS
jgi:hypothetical protein